MYFLSFEFCLNDSPVLTLVVYFTGWNWLNGNYFYRKKYKSNTFKSHIIKNVYDRPDLGKNTHLGATEETT
jgi:hypothetical protein